MSRFIKTKLFYQPKRFKRSWKTLPESGSTSQFHVRDPTVATVESKQQFQAKLKNFMTEIETAKAIEMPGRESMKTKTPSDPLLRILINGSKNPKRQYMDPKSKNILGDEALLRHFAKQSALYYETPGSFAARKDNFDVCSIESLRDSLKNPQEFQFFLNKGAKRELSKQKKLLRQGDKEPIHKQDFKVLPGYIISKQHKALATWRTEVMKHDENPLIIDMNFDHLMSKKFLSSLSRQLESMMVFNMRQPHPMHFLFTNFSEKSSVYQRLEKMKILGFPNVGFVTATNKNLFEIDGVEGEDLIYLTPDATTTLEKFDESKVYILGGLVDAGDYTGAKVTYQLSKQLGIQRVKFPLSKYLAWGNFSGRDELTLDVAYKVFHTFRNSRDWLKAFQHIPRRFHQGLSEYGLELAKNDTEMLDWYTTIKVFVHPPDSGKKKNTTQFFGWS